MPHQLRFRSELVLASCLATLSLASGCDAGTGPTPPPTPVATSISVSPQWAILVALGATTQFTAEVRDQDGQLMSGAGVTWESSDPGILQVEASSGLATALGVGEVNVMAKTGSVFGHAKGTVQQDVAAVTGQAGEDQTGFTGEALPVDLVVQVVDGGGSPIPGVRVEFSVRSGGGEVSAMSAETGTDGNASTTWTLGLEEGVQTARAFVGAIFFDFSATGVHRAPD